MSSHHSTNIKQPSSSHQYQSTTPSTIIQNPFIITKIAFHTLTTTSTTTQLKNTATYEFFDIHQITRNTNPFESRHSRLFPIRSSSCVRPKININGSNR